MRLFVYDILDSVATLPFDRIYGNSKLYISHPWFSPANASVVSFKSTIYDALGLDPLSKFTTSVHTTTSAIRRYLTYNKTTVPQNYSLSFSITPSAATYGNILQYTQDGRKNGPARFMPAIWFLPEMRLRIHLNSTEGINSTIALPLNQMSIVRIEAVGGEVRLFVNNAIDSIVFLSADRIYGDATLFVSNPWDDPANGTISPISMTSISQFSEKYWTHSTTSVIKRFLTFNKTTVPQNFSVSFDITPTGIFQYGHANILHYSRNGTKSGSSPLSTFQYVSDKSIDIYFNPNSLKLYVKVSTDKTLSTGISSSKIALPLKEATNVRVEAVGDEIRLFLNNSLDSSATVGNKVGNRVFGDSFLYVSNPWYSVANATIGPISMYPISQFTKDVCKLGVAVESSKCNCPPGYTFDVTGTKCIPLCSFGNADPTGTKCQFSSGYWTHAITSDIKPSLTNNKTFLPQNFSISFDITPKSTREEYGNILHFNNTNNGANMFDVFFLPKTTRFQIAAATKNSPIQLESKTSLPFNKVTNVRIEAVGTRIGLFINNVLDSSSSATVLDRILGGESILSVSHPGSYPGNATISPIAMTSISQFTKTVCKIKQVVDPSFCDCPTGYKFDSKVCCPIDKKCNHSI